MELGVADGIDTDCSLFNTHFQDTAGSSYAEQEENCAGCYLCSSSTHLLDGSENGADWTPAPDPAGRKEYLDLISLERTLGIHE